MFVLGIDPGLSRCGFGAVRRVPGPRSTARQSGAGGGRLTWIEHGVLGTPPEDELPSRLWSMQCQLTSLVARLRPDVVVVERVFFQTNRRTATSVSQVSGLALAAAAGHGHPVVQYTSNEVKQAVTGDGAADKKAVAHMVRTLLGLDDIPRPADASDALALALCHHQVAPMAAAVAGASSFGGSLDGRTGSDGAAGTRVAAAWGAPAGGGPLPFGNARVKTSFGGGAR